MSLEKITLNNKRYNAISMIDYFPFGGIVKAPDDSQDCVVKKELCYQDQSGLKLLQQMSTLVQGLDSQSLIKLIHLDASQPGICHLYYEYVPLTIDKWILDMGQELRKELHFELLNLASFLSHKGFKFTFNPHCVGLSQDIKVKYFLNEFAIDKENKLANYKANEKLINQFFDQLIVPEKSAIEEMTRQTLSSTGVQNSMYMSQAWQTKSWKSSNSGKGNTAKKITQKVDLMQRLEHTKKKSLQALERLKSSKLKNQ